MYVSSSVLNVPETLIVNLATTYGNYAVEHRVFSDPERRHKTIQVLKQVFIFYSVYTTLYLY